MTKLVFHGDPLVCLVLCVPVLVFLIWWVRRGGDRVLAWADGAALVLPLLFLLHPVLEWEGKETVARQVVFLHDRSFGARSTPVLQAVQQESALATLREHLAAAGYDREDWSFGAGLEKGVAGGDQIAVASQFLEAYSALLAGQGARLAAVFLLSDGGFTLPETWRGAVPVYPLVPHKSAVRNDRILGLQAPALGLDGESFEIVVFGETASARGLSIFVDGERRWNRLLPGGSFIERVRLTVHGTGEKVLRAGFDGAGDSFPADDAALRVMRFEEGRIPAVVINDRITPEGGFFLRYLRGRLQYQVQVVNDPADPQAVATVGKARVLAVFAPGSSFPEQPVFPALRRAVLGGAGLAVFLDPSAGSPVSWPAGMLPVRTAGSGPVRFNAGRFSWLPSDEGRPLLPAESLAPVGGRFPGFLWHAVGLEAAPRSRVLARIGTHPVLFAGSFGAGPVWLLACGPFWRLDFSNLGYRIASENLDRFYSAMLESLLAGKQAGPTLVPERTEYRPGDPVRIQGYGHFSAGTTVAAVPIGLGQRVEAVLAEGRAVLTVARFGEYRLVQRGPTGGERDGGGRFLVRAGGEEYVFPAAGGATLQRLADQSGGRLLSDPETPPAMPGESRLEVPALTRVSLLHNWIGLVLCVCALLFPTILRWRRQR